MAVCRTAEVLNVVSENEVLVMFVTLVGESKVSSIMKRQKVKKEIEK